MEVKVKVYSAGRVSKVGSTDAQGQRDSEKICVPLGTEGKYEAELTRNTAINPYPLNESMASVTSYDYLKTVLTIIKHNHTY